MPTRNVELTKTALDALMPAATGARYEIADSLVKGLRARVTDDAEPSGRFKGKAAVISFVLVARYPPSAHPTRRLLGRYSRDGVGMTLQDAREVARLWKSKIAAGVDPAVEAQEIEAELKRAKAEANQLAAAAEEARRSRKTLRDILDQYATEKLAHLRTGAATRRALDGGKGLLKDLVAHDPVAITRTEINAAVKEKARTAPTAANRQLAYAKAFFNWCVDENILERSPAGSVKKPAREKTRDRFHTVAELREIWSATSVLGYPFTQMFRLLIVVPMRRQEIAALPVRELDLRDDDTPHDATWILPGDRTKKRNPLRVPLSALARSIILDAMRQPLRPSESKFVFSVTGNAPSSGFSKAKKRLDDEIEKRRKKAASEAGTEFEPMEHWTLHDLRTTFNTIACDDLDIPANVADRILNHAATATTSKIMRVYNRSELFQPRKHALRRWAEFIDREIIKPRPKHGQESSYGCDGDERELASGR